MNYPLISEYIESIKSAEDNFEELTNLRPVLGDDGQPVMTSGNFAVVFKMEDMKTGKFYALKCFTKEQEGRAEAYHQIADALKDVHSSYLVSLRYLDKELFVDTNQTTETEFPVLLMDWVEGKTLDKYLRENLDDKYALEMLAYRFSQLAQWLIPQPFAHGDLKPDNILVRDDGTLVLVDYDGLYVPAMKGQKARELGSPDFRHPLRTEDDFDEHIDDFPVIIILLSLKAIFINPQLLNMIITSERLLFKENDYHCINNYIIESLLSYGDPELASLASILILYLTSYNSSFLLNRYLNSNAGNITKVSEHDYEDYISLDWGRFIYSNDKLRFLRARNNARIWYSNNYYQDEQAYWNRKYLIEAGTKVLCDRCFKNSYDDMCEIAHIIIPDSVEYIGGEVFDGSIISYIEIPDSVIYISQSAFCNCKSLNTIIIPPGKLAYFAYLLPMNISQLIEIDSKTIIHEIQQRIEKIKTVSNITNMEILGYLFNNNGCLFGLLYCNSFYFRDYNDKSVDLDYSSKRWNEVRWEDDSDQSIIYSYSHYYSINDINNDPEVAKAIFYVIIDLCGKDLIASNRLLDFLDIFLMNETKKAAEQGNSYAQNLLGTYYKEGCFVNKNYIEAIDWYMRAAEQDNPQAQFNLGECYEYGYGVMANRDKAREWYEKAAEKGLTSAIKALERFKTEDLPF